MSILDPALVARAPELAVLDILGDTLGTAIVALSAQYPDLHGDHPLHWCSSTPSSCCFANTIIENLYALDIALTHYRDFVEAELRAADRDERIDGPSYRQQLAEDRAKQRAEQRSKATAKACTRNRNPQPKP